MLCLKTIARVTGFSVARDAPAVVAGDVIIKIIMWRTKNMRSEIDSFRFRFYNNLRANSHIPRARASPFNKHAATIQTIELSPVLAPATAR